MIIGIHAKGSKKPVYIPFRHSKRTAWGQGPRPKRVMKILKRKGLL